MAKVKITSVPPGGAPLHIREQWVGVELPIFEEDLGPGVVRSVDGGKPDPRSIGGFPVKTSDAIAALRTAERTEAANWWNAWHNNMLRTGAILIFAPACGELVDENMVDEEAKQPKGHVAAMTAANKRR